MRPEEIKVHPERISHKMLQCFVCVCMKDGEREKQFSSALNFDNASQSLLIVNVELESKQILSRENKWRGDTAALRPHI